MNSFVSINFSAYLFLPTSSLDVYPRSCFIAYINVVTCTKVYKLVIWLPRWNYSSIPVWVRIPMPPYCPNTLAKFGHGISWLNQYLYLRQGNSLKCAGFLSYDLLLVPVQFKYVILTLICESFDKEKGQVLILVLMLNHGYLVDLQHCDMILRIIRIVSICYLICVTG